MPVSALDLVDRGLRLVLQCNDCGCRHVCAHALAGNNFCRSCYYTGQVDHVVADLRCRRRKRRRLQVRYPAVGVVGDDFPRLVGQRLSDCSRSRYDLREAHLLDGQGLHPVHKVDELLVGDKPLDFADSVKTGFAQFPVERRHRVQLDADWAALRGKRYCFAYLHAAGRFVKYDLAVLAVILGQHRDLFVFLAVQLDSLGLIGACILKFIGTDVCHLFRRQSPVLCHLAYSAQFEPLCDDEVVLLLHIPELRVGYKKVKSIHGFPTKLPYIFVACNAGVPVKVPYACAVGRCIVTRLVAQFVHVGSVPDCPCVLGAVFGCVLMHLVKDLVTCCASLPVYDADRLVKHAGALAADDHVHNVKDGSRQVFGALCRLRPLVALLKSHKGREFCAKAHLVVVRHTLLV